MIIKHKLTSDYQHITTDKKIIKIKSNTILEDYHFILKKEKIPIDKDIVDSNPDLFKLIDWKYDLLSYMKTNKMPSPAIISKKLIPFIEELIENVPTPEKETIIQTEYVQLDQKWIEIVERLKNEKNELRSQNNELNIKISQLLEGVELTQKQSNDINEIVEKLKTEKKELISKNSELTLKIEQLLDDSDLIQKQSTDKNDIVEKLKNEKKELILKNNELTFKIDQLLDDSDLIQKQSNNKIEKIVNENKKSIKKYEDDISKHTNEIKKLNNELIKKENRGNKIDISDDIKHLEIIQDVLIHFNHPIVIKQAKELLDIIKILKNELSLH
jgi:uncharacterized coiled-coil DUF342 family protein